MRGDWISRPDRTNLPSRLIADRKDKIHDRRTGPGEFLPTLTAQPGPGQTKPFEQFDRKRMHCAPRETARAVCVELSLAQMVQQNFGKNAARRVPSTQEQDVVNLPIHERIIAGSAVYGLR